MLQQNVSHSNYAVELITVVLRRFRQILRWKLLFVSKWFRSDLQTLNNAKRLHNETGWNRTSWKARKL